MHAGTELGVEHGVLRIRVTVGLGDAVAAGGDFALVGDLVATLTGWAGVWIALNGGAPCGAVHTLKQIGVTHLVFATGHLITGGDLALDTGIGVFTAEEVRGALALVAFTLTGITVADLIGGTGCVRAAAWLTQFRVGVAVGHRVIAVHIRGTTWCTRAVLFADESSGAVEVRGAGLGGLLADAGEGVAHLTFGAIILVRTRRLDASAINAGLFTGTLRAARALGFGARLCAVISRVTDLARDAEVARHCLTLLGHQDAHGAQIAVIVRNTRLGLGGRCARSTRRQRSQRADESEREHGSLRDVYHPLCYLHLCHNLYPHLAFDSMQIDCCVL